MGDLEGMAEAMIVAIFREAELAAADKDHSQAVRVLKAGVSMIVSLTAIDKGTEIDGAQDDLINGTMKFDRGRGDPDDDENDEGPEGYGISNG